MTKIYLHEEICDISWGDSFRGMIGKRAKEGSYVKAAHLHVDKKKIVATAAIGFTVGIVALLIGVAAIALILGLPMASAWILPVLVGVAVGTGALGIASTTFGSIAAYTLRVGVIFNHNSAYTRALYF